MLRMLKNRMRGILIATILLIIPSFVLFYGARQSGSGSGRTRHAGVVYGRNVTLEEYRQSLQWAHIFAKIRFGDEFENIQRFLDLEREAWQSIVLFETAKKRGITISDKELFNFITSLPIFYSEEGEFDPRLYHNVLTYGLGLRPEQFESFMRKSLATARLRERVADGIRVTETEVRNFYDRFNEEVRIRYVKFPAEEFLNEAEITGQMIEDYFHNNRERFRQAEARQIEYLVFERTPEEFEAGREEIEAYYRRNTEEFLEDADDETEPSKKPLEKVYDEIQSKILTAKASASARKEAEETVLDIEEGFVFWEDLERKDTGFIDSRSDAAPRGLIRKAFDSEPGLISGPIEINSRHYIFKVAGRRPDYIPSNYEMVRNEAEELARIEEANRLAGARARTFLETAEKKGGLEPAAGIKSREYAETEYFKRTDRIPGFGRSVELVSKAFALSEKNPFAAASIESGAAAIEFVEKKPADAVKYEEEKDRFRHYVESEKNERIFSDWFNLILAESEADFFLETNSESVRF